MQAAADFSSSGSSPHRSGRCSPVRSRHSRAVRQVCRRRVIRRENHRARCGHAAQQVELCRSVGRHGRVTIQMVGRDVEECGNVRTHSVYRATGQRRVKKFQLETAQFEHNRFAGRESRPVCRSAGRRYCRPRAPSLRHRQHQAHQRRRGRLAAAAGNGDEWPQPSARAAWKVIRLSLLSGMPRRTASCTIGLCGGTPPLRQRRSQPSSRDSG